VRPAGFAASILLLLLGAAALAAGVNHRVTTGAIGDGKLAQGRSAYARAYGKAVTTDQLEGGLTRVVYPTRVDVYFKRRGDKGVAIVVSSAAFRTASRVGPCSSAKAVGKAYPHATRVPLAGPEYAYRVGRRLWFEIEGGKVAAVALGTKQAAFLAANTSACGSP
jgi:hypothetical protein